MLGTMRAARRAKLQRPQDNARCVGDAEIYSGFEPKGLPSKVRRGTLGVS